MKKSICLLLVAALILPAVVSAKDWRGRGGGHQDNYSSHRHSGDRFWPVLGAVIVGSVVLDAIGSIRPPPSYVPQPPALCFSEIYGEWHIDRYGNRYWYEFQYPRRVQIPCW